LGTWSKKEKDLWHKWRKDKLSPVVMESVRRAIDSSYNLTYYRLYIQCPVCIGMGYRVPFTHWIHGNCGGYLEIGDNAHYRCARCLHEDHVAFWEYGCPYHSGGNGNYLVHKKVSVNSIIKALGIAVQMADYGGSVWMKKFLDNLWDY